LKQHPALKQASLVRTGSGHSTLSLGDIWHFRGGQNPAKKNNKENLSKFSEFLL